jgi:Transposase DNA-binding
MSLFMDGNKTLGSAIFGHAQLGDQRRTSRLIKTFDLLCRHPGGTLPDKLVTPHDLKALYRLMNRPEVTHEALLASLRAYTFQNIAANAGTVLLLHDATELDYTSRKSLVDLGQIGNGLGRGYICHQVLAVDAETRSVLGLAEQVLHRREETPQKETLAEHRSRATRESLLWIQGTRCLPRERRLVDVADQGADTFEFLEHEFLSGRTFVIRAYKPRKVQGNHDGTGPMRELTDYVESLPELGRFQMDVQPQTGRSARDNAEFVVRGGTVLVHRPHAKSGQHGDEPLPLYVVLVKETHPPSKEKPIEWLLLTNEVVQRFEDAWRVTGWYECRWVVEEYHKGQKTGVGVEQLQFTATERLEPTIALLSAVALTFCLICATRVAARTPRHVQR